MYATQQNHLQLWDKHDTFLPAGWLPGWLVCLVWLRSGLNVSDPSWNLAVPPELDSFVLRGPARV